MSNVIQDLERAQLRNVPRFKAGGKIGRASCRGRGEISVGAGSFKKKKKEGREERIVDDEKNGRASKEIRYQKDTCKHKRKSEMSEIVATDRKMVQAVVVLRCAARD